jgi:AcrR family transcriptional regulator
VSSIGKADRKSRGGVSSSPPGGDPATRQRICDAALRLILKGGGVDVSLSAVARAARVSRQALYLHFANRADLFMAVVRYADEQRGIPAAIARMERASSGLEAMKLMVESHAVMNPTIWPLARLFEAVRRDDAAAERSWQDRMSHRLQGCRAIVTKMEEEGTLRAGLAVEVAAELLWTITSLRTWEDLVLTRGWTPQQYQTRIVDLLLAALVRSDAGA